MLGWWSLFNLPREVLPEVLGEYRRVLVPGGQLITATHVGDNDVRRTEAYGGVPVQWTTFQWRPEDLAQLVVDAEMRIITDLRLPADDTQGPAVVLVAQRDG